MLHLVDAASEKLGRTSRKDAAVEHDYGLVAARRILEAGLKVCGLGESDLMALRKGDVRKAAVSALIRQRTAVPNAWIAKTPTWATSAG